MGPAKTTFNIFLGFWVISLGFWLLALQRTDHFIVGVSFE